MSVQQRPSKIICVGRSYADHAKELGNAVPEQALLFIKPPSSIVSLEQGIDWDKTLGSCHYECELCLRIDQTLSQETDPQKALQAVGAVTLGLDLTLRDVQNQLKEKGHPWERAKAFDGSCVLGDWIDVNQVVADWRNVHYDFYVDDEHRQHGDTALMLFDLGELLVEMNKIFRLEQGDVIMTGTPKGVAALQSQQQVKMVLHGKQQDYEWQTVVK